MGKARTRNAREDKKDKLAAGLKLSHKAKRQMKKALVSKEVEEARGSGKAPSAHAILRAQGIPEAKAKLGTSGGGNAVVAPSGEGKRKKKKKAAPKSKLGSGVPEGGYSKCKGGHDLGLMRTPHDEYMCDGCDSGFQKKGALLFGCRVCDWDACRCGRLVCPFDLCDSFVQGDDDCVKRHKCQSMNSTNLSSALLTRNTKSAHVLCLSLVLAPCGCQQVHSTSNHHIGIGS